MFEHLLHTQWMSLLVVVVAGFLIGLDVQFQHVMVA